MAEREEVGRMRALAVAAALLIAGSARAQVAVTTYHNDAARTGQNLQETALTPASVATGGFRKKFHYHVDGYVYGQPLYLPGVTIPEKGVHDVVYVVTEHDSVYAFDAHTNAGPNHQPLWKMVADRRAGVRPVPSRDTGCDDLVPEIGITSTPVIDQTTGTIYVVTKTKEHGAYFHRLHALDVGSGAEKFGGPVTIEATVPGTGDGSSGGVLAFDPLRQHQRAGLLLANGTVYIGWASHCTVGPYHGWVMGYDAATLAQVAVFNTTPDGQRGGVWMGGGGPAADASGNVYLATGNGTFDAGTGGKDYGDTILKLDATLGVVDWFTPYNQILLDLGDGDLGSGGTMLLPAQPGPHPDLLLQASKAGKIYLVDRDAMGHFNASDDSQIVQSLSGALGGYAFDTPAYWNGRVYYNAQDSDLRAFTLADGLLVTPPESQSGQIFGPKGATPSISANGDADAVVWAIERTGSKAHAILHAYDALDLGTDLWNSERNHHDRPGRGVKFAVPTVADGTVFVGAVKRLTVYGLP
jgi:outer membrane protein assembly factor BamB